MRILVVEDNLGDAKLLEYLDTGYDLDFARTLSEAESKISRVNYQCIILDLHLPDSSGSETVFKVKEFAPKIPIIVLTGMEDGGKIEKEVAEHVHISAFLKKVKSPSKHLRCQSPIV